MSRHYKLLGKKHKNIVTLNTVINKDKLSILTCYSLLQEFIGIYVYKLQVFQMQTIFVF